MIEVQVPKPTHAMAYDIDPSVSEAISRYIRTQFATEAISDIVIEPGGEVDGDIILNVRIVFSAKPETSRLRKLVRGVRTEIEKAHAFPVFSFASRTALVGATA